MISGRATMGSSMAT